MSALRFVCLQCLALSDGETDVRQACACGARSSEAFKSEAEARAYITRRAAERASAPGLDGARDALTRQIESHANSVTVCGAIATIAGDAKTKHEKLDAVLAWLRACVARDAHENVHVDTDDRALAVGSVLRAMRIGVAIILRRHEEDHYTCALRVALDDKDVTVDLDAIAIEGEPGPKHATLADLDALLASDTMRTWVETQYAAPWPFAGVVASADAAELAREQQYVRDVRKHHDVSVKGDFQDPYAADPDARPPTHGDDDSPPAIGGNLTAAAIGDHVVVGVVPPSPDIYDECDLDPKHDEATCPRCVRARARTAERIAAAKARGLGFKRNARDRGVRVCGCRGCGEAGCAGNVDRVCGGAHFLDDRGLCTSCAPHHARIAYETTPDAHAGETRTLSYDERSHDDAIAMHARMLRRWAPGDLCVALMDIVYAAQGITVCENTIGRVVRTSIAGTISVRWQRFQCDGPRRGSLIVETSPDVLDRVFVCVEGHDSVIDTDRSRAVAGARGMLVDALYEDDDGVPARTPESPFRPYNAIKMMSVGFKRDPVDTEMIVTAERERIAKMLDVADYLPHAQALAAWLRNGATREKAAIAAPVARAVAKDGDVHSFTGDGYDAAGNFIASCGDVVKVSDVRMSDPITCRDCTRILAQGGVVAQLDELDHADRVRVIVDILALLTRIDRERITLAIKDGAK